jgi:hypothetical protein
MDKEIQKVIDEAAPPIEEIKVHKKKSKHHNRKKHKKVEDTYDTDINDDKDSLAEAERSMAAQSLKALDKISN